jgi:hypothetical protein
MANIGNTWHIPQNQQPQGQASMRFPFEGIDAETVVTLSNGNQFQMCRTIFWNNWASTVSVFPS